MKNQEEEKVLFLECFRSILEFKLAPDLSRLKHDDTDPRHLLRAKESVSMIRQLNIPMLKQLIH
jgi:hypothetical protein